MKSIMRKKHSMKYKSCCFRLMLVYVVEKGNHCRKANAPLLKQIFTFLIAFVCLFACLFSTTLEREVGGNSR